MSKFAHWFISFSCEMPETTEQTKTPLAHGGVSGSGFCEEIYRTRRPEVPGWGPFFKAIAAREIMIMRE
jgi:hypothetical protein